MKMHYSCCLLAVKTKKLILMLSARTIRRLSLTERDSYKTRRVGKRNDDNDKYQLSLMDPRDGIVL